MKRTDLVFSGPCVLLFKVIAEIFLVVSLYLNKTTRFFTKKCSKTTILAPFMKTETITEIVIFNDFADRN